MKKVKIIPVIFDTFLCTLAGLMTTSMESEMEIDTSSKFLPPVNNSTEQVEDQVCI